MTNLTTFNYLSNTVRVVEIDGQPWFVTKDVCELLGYRPHPNGGYQNALRLVSTDEKKVLEKSHSSGEWVLFEGTAARASLISESGLYKLIVRSDKPEARKFQDWVTREVLPAIRKDGMYVAGEEKLKTECPVAERQRLARWRKSTGL
ncbi:Bro-N domain-containing protein [Pannonibacter sp. Pt2]|uniref:Bro-N domain-containing protein n=1 Tax=Pannonibacter anstelovis TaxID=3121537 RepID=A0ABU7ZSB8_9HYPH